MSFGGKLSSVKIACGFAASGKAAEEAGDSELTGSNNGWGV